MVHFCAFPGCSNRFDRESYLSYHRLPLKNRKVLKIWIHKIDRKHLPLIESTRVCSEHFVNSMTLSSDQTPTLKLPTLPTTVTPNPPRRPLVRRVLPERTNKSDFDAEVRYAEVGVNTDLTFADIDSLEREISEVKDLLQQSNRECEAMKRAQKFSLENIGDDDGKLRFYTGFSTLAALIARFQFLGPSVNKLSYYPNTCEIGSKCNKGRPRTLSTLDEFFLVLMWLCHQCHAS